MSELYIGLMSGTSMDAIDGVLVQIDADGKPALHTSLSFPIPIELRNRLLQLSVSDQWRADEFAELDVLFSEHSAVAVNELLSKAQVPAGNVTAIASHGQTVRHKPGHRSPYTLQLGDPSKLAFNTQIDVIHDFRRKDVAAGGQGAPLVPAFHRHIFAQPEKSVAIVNLGGIANITWLGPQQQLLGFDTGPANTLMDQWIQHCNANKSYDENGHLASQGKVIEELLNVLLQHPFFSRKAPKSTGREEFNLAYLKPLLKANYTPEDVQRTLLALTAETLSNEINGLPTKPEQVYFCGGGTNNELLITEITQRLGSTICGTTQALGVDPQWVEAMAFAWLGWCYEHKKPGNHPAVTGAAAPVVLGSKTLFA
jgi:anhydro-N-acetylmuramic acid kinase